MIVRKENGHVFQGRDKALLLDGDAIAAACHYIHLNPVRAGLVAVQDMFSVGGNRIFQWLQTH